MPQGHGPEIQYNIKLWMINLFHIFSSYNDLWNCQVYQFFRGLQINPSTLPLESETPCTALVLNYKLPKFFAKLWNNAKTRVCVDSEYSQDNNTELQHP